MMSVWYVTYIINAAIGKKYVIAKMLVVLKCTCYMHA